MGCNQATPAARFSSFGKVQFDNNQLHNQQPIAGGAKCELKRATFPIQCDGCCSKTGIGLQILDPFYTPTQCAAIAISIKHRESHKNRPKSLRLGLGGASHHVPRSSTRPRSAVQVKSQSQSALPQNVHCCSLGYISSFLLGLGLWRSRSNDNQEFAGFRQRFV